MTTTIDTQDRCNLIAEVGSVESPRAGAHLSAPYCYRATNGRGPFDRRVRPIGCGIPISRLRAIHVAGNSVSNK